MRARSLIAGLIALFAILTILDRFVVIEILVRRLSLPLLGALLVAAAILGTGTLVRGARSVDMPLDFLIGFPLFGTICFLAAAISARGAVLIPLAAAGAAWGLFVLWWRRSSAAPWRLPPMHAATLAVAAVLACGFVTAQAPPASLDELAYHLAVPRAWLLEGRAIDLPLNSHSYFPLAIESASMPLLAALGPLDGGIASHLLHLLAAVATTLLLVRRSQSWMLTAAIVSTPALAVTAGWSLLEWPLAGLFVALYGALQDGDRRLASLVTAAGLLTKYTFVPFAAIAWLVKRRLPDWAALAGSVFFLRNLLLTGNPVAPFFTSGAPHVGGYRSLALADYVFEGTFLDESLGVSILALPAFAMSGIAVAALVLAVLLFFLSPSSRILVPYLAVASIEAAPRLRGRLVRSALVIAILLQTFFVIWFTGRGSAFSLLAGRISDEEFLRSERSTYATIEWINDILPDDARLLLIGSGESYWLRARSRSGGNFDGPRISRYLEPTGDALRERLRGDGITHVAVIAIPPPTTDERKRAEREVLLSPSARRALAVTLDQHAATVATSERAVLFTLR